MKKLSLSAFVLSLALTGSGAFADYLAISGATVIDATGADPIRNGVVLIEDDRIVAVGARGDVKIPGEARVIDARGQYVIPGLMDANLHLMLNIDLETLIKFEGRYHEIVLEAAQIALKTGQTTVFDTWGPRAALVTARDMINAGEAPGARIYLAGNIIGFDGPLSADFAGAAAPFVSKSFAGRINETWQQGTGRELMWMTPEDVRDRVREYAQKHVDFLKYAASGHTDMFFIQFSPRVQRAIVEEGQRAGMTVQTHTTSVESLDMAIEAGVDIITHGDISGPSVAIPEETLRKMVERGVAASVLPITQRRTDALSADEDNMLGPYMKIGRENQQKMIEAGVTVLLSTDAGIEHPVLFAESDEVKVDPRSSLGKGHFHALTGLEELGMEPMEILKSATSHIARAYKLGQDLGTLEAGKLADLVILNRNPLEAAANYRSIVRVIKAGEEIDLDALPVAPVISSIPEPQGEGGENEDESGATAEES